jgi:phage terminase small subunit
MGRPKLSKAVHDARGHAGKRPSKTDRENPQPKVAGPEPPVWLTYRPALAVWRREIGKRVALSMHTEWDVNAFARYCVLQGMEEVAVALLSEPDLEKMLASGLFVIGKTGPVMSPVVSLLYDLETKLAAGDTQFGLTPKARGSLHVPGALPEADAAREQEFG